MFLIAKLYDVFISEEEGGGERRRRGRRGGGFFSKIQYGVV